MDPASGIYSCDDHLDLRAVPPDLWASRLSSADAARGPHVVERNGERVWMCEDRVLGGSGAPADATLLKSLSAIGRAGIEDDGYRPGRPDLRLLDMDRDGLAASVIYGPLALGLPIDDPALQDRCYAAWNDWAIEEFNAVSPDRLCVLAFIPSHSPEAAVAEIERCAALGHRGAIVDIFGMDIGAREWDPLWAAAAAAGIPLSFHLKGGSWSGLSYRMGEWQSAAFATVLPLQLDEPLATMLFSGALERHPDLTIVLAESGVGWLPYFIARADLEWEALRGKVADMPATKPSELFQRNVMATFEEDSLVEDVIPVLGADKCMWASDYPHTDSTFPNSLKVIDETLGALSPADRRKVVATNCAELYGFAAAT
jgi:predicted TIM-barrel fold metal-dependent hydrolase